jgi:hypothetical protein
MHRSAICVALLGAAIGLGVSTDSHATTYVINQDYCSTPCGAAGTINVSGEGTSTLSVDVELTNGFLHTSTGLNTLNFSLSGAQITSANIANVVYEGTQSAFSFSSSTTGTNVDGSGSWLDLLTLTGCTGGANTCGTSLTFDIINLTPGVNFLSHLVNGVAIYFGVNVSSTTSSSTANTGIEGAVLSPSPVPLPPAVLLFGSALVGMGLLGRRRKKGPAQAI